MNSPIAPETQTAESSTNSNLALQSPTASPASPASTSTSPSGLRRSQSQQDRINNILTNARRRSVALNQPTTMSPTYTSPSPLLEAESDVDETTGIVRGRTRSYKSITGNFPASDTRRVSSIARNGGNDSGRQGTGTVRQENGSGTEENEESWMKKTLAKYGSIELENKGSVARDHLALERTFLAWLRTSLAFASIGIAITQLFRLNTASVPANNSDAYVHFRHLGKPLGATFLAISILVLWIGFHRYFESQHWIIRGKFPASRGSVFLVAFIAAALMVISLVIILVVQPTSYEK